MASAQARTGFTPAPDSAAAAARSGTDPIAAAHAVRSGVQTRPQSRQHTRAAPPTVAWSRLLPRTSPGWQTSSALSRPLTLGLGPGQTRALRTARSCISPGPLTVDRVAISPIARQGCDTLYRTFPGTQGRSDFLHGNVTSSSQARRNAGWTRTDLAFGQPVRTAREGHGEGSTGIGSSCASWLSTRTRAHAHKTSFDPSNAGTAISGEWRPGSLPGVV